MQSFEFVKLAKFMYFKKALLWALLSMTTNVGSARFISSENSWRIGK